MCRVGQEDTAYDPPEHMQKRAAALGVTVWLRGEYPTKRAARELYALILRECTSNCVRHAGASELYADSARSGQLCIKNNGLPPTKTVRESGGLSSLRRRIEKAGGTMTVHSLPNFVLEITLPHKEEQP